MRSRLRGLPSVVGALVVALRHLADAVVHQGLRPTRSCGRTTRAATPACSTSSVTVTFDQSLRPAKSMERGKAGGPSLCWFASFFVHETSPRFISGRRLICRAQPDTKCIGLQHTIETERSTMILYFSGTGNSHQRAARRLAEALDDEVVSHQPHHEGTSAPPSLHGSRSCSAPTLCVRLPRWWIGGSAVRPSRAATTPYFVLTCGEASATRPPICAEAVRGRQAALSRPRIGSHAENHLALYRHAGRSGVPRSDRGCRASTRW